MSAWRRIRRSSGSPREKRTQCAAVGAVNQRTITRVAGSAGGSGQSRVVGWNDKEEIETTRRVNKKTTQRTLRCPFFLVSASTTSRQGRGAREGKALLR